MTDITDFPNRPDILTATISASGTTSATVDLKGGTLSAFKFPSALVGTAVTFQGSLDGTNFGTVKDELGADLTWTFSANGVVSNMTNNFFGIRYVRVVSNDTETSEVDFILQPEYI